MIRLNNQETITFLYQNNKQLKTNVFCFEMVEGLPSLGLSSADVGELHCY